MNRSYLSTYDVLRIILNTNLYFLGGDLKTCVKNIMILSGFLNQSLETKKPKLKIDENYRT